MQGSPVEAAFLRVQPPWHLSREQTQVGMSLKGRGEALRGRSSETSSWVFAQAHSTLIYSPGRQLSQRLSVHEEPELDMEQCCFLVATSYNNTMKSWAAAAAKSLQSCPTLCDPINSSPPGSPVPGILQARTLEWVAISFSNA